MEFDVMTRATTWDHVADLARRHGMTAAALAETLMQPNLASAVGLQFYTQGVVFDPAIAQPFQIGASSGRQFVIVSP